MHPDALWRGSRRGLVLAGTTGETVLLEHPRALALPQLLADQPSEAELRRRLGPPLDESLLADLIELGILTQEPTGTSTLTPTVGSRRFTWSRSGLMIAGIDRPARWLDRWVVPGVLSLSGRMMLAALVIAGVVALLAGRPDVATVSTSPGTEALLMLGLGLTATAAHELGHAVALVHDGRRPTRAGFGFYWGAVSFFVDSTPALTLNRRQRVTQALIGLGVDVVTTALFAVLAQLASSDLLAIVFWRLAILSVLDIAINAAPVLQVDGHWALADLLDEPDLGPRARRALGAATRGRLSPGEGWLATYGAVSLLAGIGLLTVSVLVFWVAAGDLMLALFAGSAAEIALGLYFVVPLILGTAFSLLGLILETLPAPRATEASAAGS